MFSDERPKQQPFASLREYMNSSVVVAKVVVVIVVSRSAGRAVGRLVGWQAVIWVGR